MKRSRSSSPSIKKKKSLSPPPIKKRKKSEESGIITDSYTEWSKDKPRINRLEKAVEAGFFTREEIEKSYKHHLTAVTIRKNKHLDKGEPLVIVNEVGCWISRATPGDRYPRITIKGSKVDIKFMLHHIVMYLHGISVGLTDTQSQELDELEDKESTASHKCDDPRCFWFRHLTVEILKDNMSRRYCIPWLVYVKGEKDDGEVILKVALHCSHGNTDEVNIDDDKCCWSQSKLDLSRNKELVLTLFNRRGFLFRFTSKELTFDEEIIKETKNVNNLR